MKLNFYNKISMFIQKIERRPTNNKYDFEIWNINVDKILMCLEIYDCNRM